jgi:cytochrome c oxidase subunit 4
MTYHSQFSEARHVNYVRVWGVLIAALVVSLLLALAHQQAIAAALIFAIAIVKALIVAGYYMHLKFEPRYIVITAVAGLITLSILFIGLFYDIVQVYGG